MFAEGTSAETATSPFVALAHAHPPRSSSGRRPASPLLQLTRASFVASSGAFGASEKVNVYPPVVDVRAAGSELVITDDGISFDRTDEHRVFSFEIRPASPHPTRLEPVLQVVTFRFSALRRTHQRVVVPAFAERRLNAPAYPSRQVIFDMAKKEANVKYRSSKLAEYLRRVLNARDPQRGQVCVVLPAVNIALGFSDEVCYLVGRAAYLAEHGLPVEPRAIVATRETALRAPSAATLAARPPLAAPLSASGAVLDAWLERGAWQSGASGVLRFAKRTEFTLTAWDETGCAHVNFELRPLLTLRADGVDGRSFTLGRTSDGSPLAHFGADGASRTAWTVHRAGTAADGAFVWTHYCTVRQDSARRLYVSPHCVSGAWTASRSAFVLRDARESAICSFDARGTRASGAVSAGADALVCLCVGLVATLLPGEA